MKRIYCLSLELDLYEKLRFDAFRRRVSKASIINELLAKKYAGEEKCNRKTLNY